MHPLSRLVALFATLALASCAGVATTANCSHPMLCVEYTATSDILTSLKAQCTGNWSNDACTRANAIGGCSMTSTVEMLTQVQWFYTGYPLIKSAADVMAECDGGSFVSP